MTRYAALILQMIQMSSEHLTAEQIFLSLKETEPKIVLATVYNNLNQLHAQNLIRKITMAGSPDRYDVTKKHDHLICQKCGKLSDICFSDFTRHLEEQLQGSILGYDLKVFYLCPDCKKEQEE